MKWFVVSAALAAAIVSTGAGTRRGLGFVRSMVVGDSSGDTLQGRDDCPQDSVLIQLRNRITGSAAGPVITHVPLSRPITNIPEFHDCQRFIPEAWHPDTHHPVPPRFDSLYAIFAAFHLDSLTKQSFANTERAVATIYSWGGTYHPLGIWPGFNCLFLFLPPHSSWSAVMLPWGADSNCLSHAPDTTGPHRTLEVHHNQPSPHLTDYPPVARWDWDTVNHHQYIGIRCADEWCDVGEPGFTSSPAWSTQPPFDPSPMMPANPDRVHTIKGWYDEQLLDTLDHLHHILVPSNVRGYLFPHPALDLLHANLANFHDDEWVHVADAFVTGDYKDVFKKGFNKIYTCLERHPLHNCGVNLASPPLKGMRPLNKCDGDPAFPTGRWWAKIVRLADDSIRYQCIKVRDHTHDIQAYLSSLSSGGAGWTVSIPGAARWRWLLTDTEKWYSCELHGCCTGQ